MTNPHRLLIFTLVSALLNATTLFAQTDVPASNTSPVSKNQQEPTSPLTAMERLFGAGVNKAASNSNTSGALGATSKIGTTSNEPLPVEQAFKISANRKPTGITITLEAAEGYYLYREKIKILATETQNDLTPRLPKGEIKFDETFGKNVATFRGVLAIPEVKVSNTSNQAFSLDVYSQGCADIGICYPPQYHRLDFPPNQVTPTIGTFDPPTPPKAQPQMASSTAKGDQKAPSRNTELSLTSASAQTTIPAAISDITSNKAIPNETNAQGLVTSNPSSLSNQDQSFSQLFKNANPLWLALTFMGLGLLLAFTPCVLPMVPIVSAIVLGKHSLGHTSEMLSARQAFQRSVCYVLGMCVTYTAAGVLAGLAGQGLAGFLQQPWVLCTFAALMVVLAGGQFGWYRITLPSTLMGNLANTQNQLKGVQQTGALRYIAITFMGALSALMVGPCLTAPLAGALGYIAQTGDAWRGGVALFGLSLGMGIPLLLISVGGARFLPKTGPWMSQVNYGFGLMLLAVALWMVQSLLTAWLFTLLCLCLLLLAAQALGAFQVFDTQPNKRYVGLLRGLGLLILVWAIALVWGMAAGRFDPITPLKAGTQAYSSLANVGSKAASSAVSFETIAAADVAMRLSAKPTSQGIASKPILLDLYADWCVSCIEFERFTFTDPQVAAQMSAFTLLRVDVTQNTVADRALLQKFGLFGPPAILFFKQSADTPFAELRSSRVIGFQAAPQFLQQLLSVLSAKR